MTFQVAIFVKAQKFVLLVEQTFVNSSFEELEARYKEQVIKLRSNHPELERLQQRGKIHFQLLSINFKIRDKEAAAMFMLRLFDALQEHFKPTPDFNQVRAQQKGWNRENHN